MEGDTESGNTRWLSVHAGEFVPKRGTTGVDARGTRRGHGSVTEVANESVLALPSTCTPRVDSPAISIALVARRGFIANQCSALVGPDEITKNTG